MLAGQKIAETDLELFTVTDDVDVAMELITSSHVARTTPDPGRFANDIR